MPGRLLATPPWRRAPLQLLRAPGTALAVAGAGVVVAFVAASWPLFLGSVVDASQERQVRERCTWDIGATVTPTAGFTSAANPDRVERLEAFGASVADVAAATPGFGAPVRTTTALVELVPPDGPARVVQLLARTAAVDHVAVAAGDVEGGVLVADRTYEELALTPGTVVGLQAGSSTTEAEVAGAYEQLTDPLPAHWCSLRDSFLPRGYGGDPPPPVVLVGEAMLDDVVEDLAVPVAARWELPVDERLGVEEAAAVADRIGGLEDGIEHRLVAGGRLGPGDAGRGAGPVEAVRAVTSTLPFIVRQSEVVAAGLESGLAPTVAAAAVAGALLLLATGWFWSERRGGELAVLRRLGAGPAAIGVKGVVELLLPAVAGALSGLAVAMGMVAAVGPGGLPGAGPLGRAAWWAGGATALGLVGAGVVAGVRSALADRSGGAATAGSVRSWGRRLAAVPWEVGVLALAVSVAGDQGRRSLAVGQGRLDLDALSFVLPVVVVAAVGVLLSRTLRFALARAGRRGDGLPVPAWLALKRLAGRPGAPALFTACVVTAVGVLVYANGASSSLQRSLEDKAALAVGADALVRTVGVAPVPPEVGAVSPVGSIEGVQRSDPVVTILGVEPATALDVVRFPGTSRARLSELLEAISAPSSGRVPALLVGGPLPEGGVVELLANDVDPLRVDVVARLDGFPGMDQSRPTVVITLDRLRATGAPRTESLWVRGEVAPVVDRLAQAGIDVGSVRVPDQALDTATFVAVIWTFGFVRALAVLGGAVSAVGLLVYLDARQRARLLAYGLSRHMGLERRAHRRSVGLELLAIAAPATLGGVAVGIVVTAVFVPPLDPLARFEPPTEALVPWPVIAAAAALAALLCLVGALVGQRAADRVELSTALRHGG